MIISIINHKGGTAKTTTTVNLGSALANEGQRVLVVDLDAQGNLSYSLGADAQTKTIADVLTGDATLTETLVAREHMHLLPANETLADVELALAQMNERFHHLKELLSPLRYDFVLIDCPPSLSLLTLNALMASQYLIVPMQMDVLALRGLDSILSTVKKIRPMNPSMNVLGVLPVMVDVRKNIHTEVVNHIKSNYPTRIFTSIIRPCVKAAEAPSFGKSVVQYAPGCSTAQDYTAFAKEVMQLVLVGHPQAEMVNR